MTEDEAKAYRQQHRQAARVGLAADMIGCACDIRRGVTTNGGMQKLKLICVLMAVAFLPLMRVTPALAASREVENFCYEQLGRATLPLRPRGAGEAFMANCIADLTLTPIKKRRYRKY
jgi:hypothetical protein